MRISNLIIEVTRRCNFECEHCLRGTKQNKDMPNEVIEALLFNNDIEDIGSVTFTGGEPSLNVEAIEYFIKACKHKHIDVGSFYVATNGGKSSGSDEFIKVMIDLYLMCSDNEASSVDISQSDFHDCEGQDEEAMRRLRCLSFTRHRGKLDSAYLLNEGRAKSFIEMNGSRDTARKVSIDKELIIEIEGGEILNDEFYVNVKGDVVLDCNVSYARQDRNKIGNVLINKIEEMAK